MFFVKPKKLILDCFTNDSSAYTIAPIVPLRSVMPDWWKKLPHIDENEFVPQVNMRKCSGFINNFNNGFSIPMWSDLHVEVGPVGSSEYRWQYSDKQSTLGVHSADQWGEFVSVDKYQHVKLNSPWALRANKKCYFSWAPATWNQIGLGDLKGVHILPGVDEYFYQRSSTINILLERNEATTLYKFPLAQPLVHAIPLTEDRLEIKVHLIADEEFNKIIREAGDNSSFTGWYYKAKKIKNAKKCPFS